MKASDIPAITSLTVTKASTTGYREIEITDAIKQGLKQLYFSHVFDKGKIGWVSEDDKGIHGVLTLAVVPHYSGKNVAHITMYFVEDGYLGTGAWLLKRAIKWAKQQPKVNEINIAPSGGMDNQQDVDRFFSRMMPKKSIVYSLEV